MRVLISNDDGIAAPGLRALIAELGPLAELSVFAPEREQSCSGHAITLHKPLRLREVTLEGVRGPAYATSGTPADCIVLARVHEKAPPDLVVSGINAGANLGEEVFYSGTVAAAMEGCLQGLRSLAVSVTAYRDCDFSAAARFAARFAPVYREMQLPEGMFLNVNVPSMSPERIQGIRVTRLGRRGYENFIERREDPRGVPYYWFGGEATETDSAAGTDIAAVQANMISVSPILVDITAYEATRAVQEALAGFSL